MISLIPMILNGLTMNAILYGFFKNQSVSKSIRSAEEDLAGGK